MSKLVENTQKQTGSAQIKITKAVVETATLSQALADGET